MSRLKVKKLAKPATRKVFTQEEIDDMCGLLAHINMWDHSLRDDYSAVDQVVRLLQGDNYKKFVADTEKEYSSCLRWNNGGNDED